ncbi:MAG: polysaccharide deacetylase family protein [Bacteroidota bacterium]
MLLYAHTITPRLTYITQWFQEHYLTEPFELTDSLERFHAYSGARINYSDHRMSDETCWIEPAALLFEQDVRIQSITVSTNDSFPIFFCGRGNMGFDVFAAAFYLISRYEEYHSTSPDIFGRFDHRQSMAHQYEFLHRPIVDEWMTLFCSCLRTTFPSIHFRNNTYQRLTTYDIDESYAYRYKSIWLQLGGFARDLFMGRFSWVAERIRTIGGSQKDPYDSYSFMQELHPSSSSRPICFFPVAIQKNARDKNPSPLHPAQIELIRSVATWSDVGLHPSWNTIEDASLLAKEKQVLEGILGKQVHRSRQHYIRFLLPDTYRTLIGLGISDEYSMGYGAVNGFRAGTSRSFFWFDLLRNDQTSLRIHPFCYMDANGYYELRHTPSQAEQEWKQLEQSVKSVNGQMISIWHNSILGTQKRFDGWRDRYADWFRSG